MAAISFTIPNAWGRCLYDILSPIKEQLDGIWHFDDLQAWENTDDNLFEEDTLSSADFFERIETHTYYIVSGQFRLYPMGQDDMLLEVRITDSVYVDIFSENKDILSHICQVVHTETNAGGPIRL